MQGWNEALWFDVTSHMTCSNQSELSISAKQSYDTLKFKTFALGFLFDLFSVFSNKRTNFQGICKVCIDIYPQAKDLPRALLVVNTKYLRKQ